jgi:tetratricopeptide (TPR) repeat protein
VQKRSFFFALLFFLTAFTAGAQFNFSQNCRKAYSALTAFDVHQAHFFINREKSLASENKIIFYLEDYSDFMEILFLEDQVQFDRYKKIRDNRLRLISRDATISPYKNFTQASILIHSSILKLKFGENFSAATDVQKAYKLLNENEKNFPDFFPTQMLLLPLKATIGTVPENYRWIIGLLGMEGDLVQSVAAYEKLIPQIQQHQEHNIFLKEAQVMLTFMQLYLLNNRHSAWETVKVATTDYNLNPVSAFLRANIALRLKNNEEVLDALSTFTREDAVIPHLDYLAGIARLHKLDDRARLHFARYLKNFKGNSYRKDSYLKIAWAYAVKDDKEGWIKSISLARKLGNTIREEDKQVLEEIKSDEMPHRLLLQARLLFDGGYHNRAKQVLGQVELNSLKNEQQTEYYYRLGRINHEQRNYNAALENYKLAEAGVTSTSNYFLPASALFVAQIYEQQKDFEKAVVYYRKCLSYKNYPYKNSFDQKANAGIKRIGSR